MQRPDYQRVFEAIPHPSLLILPHPPYTIVAANGLYLHVHKTDHQHILGQEMDRCDPDVMASLQKVLQQKVPQKLPLQKVSMGQEDHYFQIIHGPVLNSQGKVEFILQQEEDVTDLYHLINDQKPHQHRDEILSIASHELKTPISSMLLNLQMIKRSALKGQEFPARIMIQKLDPILNQLSKLTRMIDNLLDISRIQNKKLNLEKEVVDLNQLMQDLIGRLHPLAASYGVELHFHSQNQIVGYWDPLRLDQIFTNLINNAIKYGESKPVDVTIQADEEKVRIQVQDQGKGIDPADHEKIFQQFTRTTHKHANQSLGLGLFIVRELVHAHGGEIHLDSGPGRGSNFAVELPRYVLPEYAQTDQGIVDEAATQEKTH